MTTIDQIIAEKIGSWQIGEWPIGNFVLCVIALLLSAFLCGVIGFEREVRGRAAGLRTHILVGLGSCIIMIISIYGFPNIVVDNQVLNRDVARLAAYRIAWNSKASFLCSISFLSRKRKVYRIKLFSPLSTLLSELLQVEVL